MVSESAVGALRRRGYTHSLTLCGQTPGEHTHRYVLRYLQDFTTIALELPHKPIYFRNLENEISRLRASNRGKTLGSQRRPKMYDVLLNKITAVRSDCMRSHGPRSSPTRWPMQVRDQLPPPNPYRQIMTPPSDDITRNNILFDITPGLLGRLCPT